jgi:hypothetical protein
MEKNMNPQELQIQGLVDRYLASRYPSGQTMSAHPDDDSLSAFVEGTLNRRESESMVTHLVDCGYCRNVTAELVRLDLAFAEDEAPARVATTAEPARVSEVLSNIFSRIFGSSEGTVFAHQEPEEKKEDEKADEEKKD